MGGLYKPVVRGRASICNWELQFEFLTKEQCVKFIKLYMELEIPISFSYRCESGDSIIPDKHIIEVERGVWASNLVTLASILEKVDYNGDLD